MKKSKEEEMLIASVCCSLANNTNNFCMLCPWLGTKKCEKAVFSEELIKESIMNLRGIKFMDKIKLSEIKVSKAFLETNPRQEKMDKYREYWKGCRQQLKPIVINKHGYIQDGYIQYLILKENNQDECFVVVRCESNKNKKIKTPYYRNNKTTYVYGTHLNSECDKTYVWRVPHSWINWSENLKLGDVVMCQTKFGITPVSVSKIEELDVCQVPYPVKKVSSRRIEREGMSLEI